MHKQLCDDKLFNSLIFYDICNPNRACAQTVKRSNYDKCMYHAATVLCMHSQGKWTRVGRHYVIYDKLHDRVTRFIIVSRRPSSHETYARKLRHVSINSR